MTYYLNALEPGRSLRVHAELKGIRIHAGLLHPLFQYSFLPIPPAVMVGVEDGPELPVRGGPQLLANAVVSVMHVLVALPGQKSRVMDPGVSQDRRHTLCRVLGLHSLSELLVRPNAFSGESWLSSRGMMVRLN